MKTTYDTRWLEPKENICLQLVPGDPWHVGRGSLGKKHLTHTILAAWADLPQCFLS